MGERGRPFKFTPAQVIAALQYTRGMVVLAAEHLGCEPNTVANYVKRYATVARALQEQREKTTDLAELKLYQAISNGEPWAIQFYLKTQGRQRGYTEKLMLEVEIHRVAARVGEEYGMTAEEVIAEAEAYIRAERD
jgi:hypothetical protein